MGKIFAKKMGPMVLSHNDYHTGNMLWDMEKAKFHMIDFSTVAINYAEFDLANYFISLGLNEDHPDLYPRIDQPTLAYKERFVRTYLQARDDIVPSSMKIMKTIERADCVEMLSHLKWGLWWLRRSYMVHQDWPLANKYARIRLQKYLSAVAKYAKDVKVERTVDDFLSSSKDSVVKLKHLQHLKYE